MDRISFCYAKAIDSLQFALSPESDPQNVMIGRPIAPRVVAMSLHSGRLEIQRRSGDVVHVSFDEDSNTWTVDEDSEHLIFRSQEEAELRARLIDPDPDMLSF
jgi:hypothetical protein